MRKTEDQKAKSGLLLVNASERDKAGITLPKAFDRRGDADAPAYNTGKPAALTASFERKKERDDSFGFWAYAITARNTISELVP